MCGDTDFAWLAGLIDGDGSFYCTKNSKGRVEPHLTIEMACETTIDHIIATFGGAKYKTNHTDRNRRTIYRWRPSLVWVRLHGPQLIPFLITKKGRAIAMVELLQLRHASGNRGINDEERQIELAALIKGANFVTPAQ